VLPRSFGWRYLVRPFPISFLRIWRRSRCSSEESKQAQNRATVSQALERIRQAARLRKNEKFTAVLHHISLDLLDEEFSELKGNAAAGVDGLMWRDYEQNLERNLEDLHSRVHRGAYRAMPSRRVYIPKPDGRQRPLAVAALEDKIVQRAAAAVLNAIYEEDFLGILVWLSARTRGARCARGRNRKSEGELHLGRRHPFVL
jgi:RNA-directed DNA polymerase